MNKSESIKELATALAKCQGEMKNPPKSADNPFFKSKYAALDTIVDTVRPVMAKYGLSFIQSCSSQEQNITVTTLLMHSSGEWIESDPMTVKATKLDPQGAGSAITYARRYTLAAMLGVASEEDDDGNNASQTGKPPKNQQPKNESTKSDTVQVCADCNKSVSGAVAIFCKSNPKFEGKIYCPTCQKKHK